VSAGILLGFSILTKGLVGCVFATIFAACLAAVRRDAIPRLAIALVIAGVAAILVALPWYIAMEQAHPGYLHYYFVERHLQGYLTATQRHAGRPWWYYLPIVFGGALPWTLFLFTGATRNDRLRTAIWAWFGLGLIFLSVGESKLVTYVLPLFPALALLVGDNLARYDAARRGPYRIALAVMALCLTGIPAAGLAGLQWKYGASHSGLWLPIAACGAAVLYCAWRAWRTDDGPSLTSWCGAGAIASLIAMMLVMRPAASWMTARDLAAAVNADGRLPPRVSVVDERIGSLVFYLAPPLRADANAERLVETSFAEALARVRVDADESIVALRVGQMDRLRRLLPGLPEPDQRAGTFALYRGRTLKQALNSRQ
jgi:4-amino-4-deoxy-L-arabinose transferase-like glycosyltransferase